ncbi:transcriptional regulator, AraC family [Methylocaldum marinum]|uniref:Transcriptional regulator, AraC family n=1 Tax=Methylocaldum marinum TaxID=1432792 RepID=A0A250L1R6_9GAMM|nr:transcriptional regulator, AraC family [Methylocaldum marinum]
MAAGVCLANRTAGHDRISAFRMGAIVRRSAILADEDARPGRDVGKGFPTLYYEFRVVRKGLEKTPDRSPQAWRALQV